MRVRPIGVLLLLASALACASTPERRDEEVVAVPEETPEIPVAPRKKVVEPAPSAAPGGEVEAEGPKHGGSPADDAKVDGARAEGTVPESPPETVAPRPPARRETPGRAAFEAGVAAASRQDWATAERHFQEAVARDARLEWGWYNLGVVREHQAKYDEAEEAYRKALEIRPDFTEAAANLTRLLAARNQAPLAERELRRWIQAHPEALGLRNQLAQALVYQGSPDKLEQAFTEARKVLKADERNVGAMIVLAQVFYKQKKYELAGSVLDNALKIEPNNAVAHLLRGFVYLTQKDRKKAFQSFKTAATLRGDLVEAQINYGAFLNEAQDWEKAVAALEMAKKYAPQRADVYLNLGNAYRGAGRAKDALEAYRMVQKLEPQNREVLFNLGLLHLDSELPGVDTLSRLQTAKIYFERYKNAGGHDERLDALIKDAERAIGKEKRRLEREAKERLRAAEEAKKKAEEEAKRKAEEEAKKKAEEEARRKAEEEAKKKAEAEAKKKAEQEAKKKAQKKRAADAEKASTRLGEEDAAGPEDSGSVLGGDEK